MTTSFLTDYIVELSPDTGSLFFQNINNTKIIISPISDLSISKANIKIGSGFNMLSWAGNSINGGANTVSGNFRANGSAEYGSSNTTILSANFITKDIAITTSIGGTKSAIISSNIDNFSQFNYIDLAGYVGTGSIHLDGQAVATEGAHTFDAGIIFGNAIINNNAYNDVSNIQQSQYFPSTPISFSLTGFADNVHLINANSSYNSGQYFPTFIRIFEDATAASKVHVELAKVQGPNVTTDLNIDIGKEFNPYTDTAPAYDSGKINGGTFAVTSHYTNHPVKEILNISSNFTHSELTLSGGSNHITDISLNGFALGGENNYVLKLNIKAGFTDSLAHIYVDELSNPNGNLAPISVDINTEIGGTGGGDFYNTLGGLQNSSQFSGIINSLAGKQLLIEGQSQDDSFSVVGNTTVSGHGSGAHGDTINFANSTISSLVKITDYNAASDIVNAGSPAQQWTFSQAGDKSLVSYGDYGSSANLNDLFSTLGGVTDAQSLFSAALSKATNGSSEHSLADAGAIKLGNSLYVIIDNNGNHSFDSGDLVFSLGNRDMSQTLSDVHYSAPQIELNGSASSMPEALV
ncbi:hypothetical protein R6Y99_16210 [Pseudomonas lundensis]|uniref:hypothetical protein n=1 Tax=Serratia proteamaculans TaxID=28151 RepID=UPI002980D3CA|nr:hypothetical protein [Serratia proteamaculans]MDW5501337.1 hypothetical protein [Serratia proteamaculans]MDW5506401.1 hypothetical protein [Pseudomonas lundensis]